MGHVDTKGHFIMRSKSWTDLGCDLGCSVAVKSLCTNYDIR